jgi:threonine dehydrogenase-like Zn-dependent dehydrogenase
MIMQETMKSLVTDGKQGLAFAQVPVPSFGPYQALVRMESCGICSGTDSKIVHGTFKNISQYPAILGHEGVGIVVARGALARHLQLGDRVLLPFVEKPAGGFYSAWGAFSEYGIVGDGLSMQEDGIGPKHPDYSEAYFAQLTVPAGIDAVNGCMIITFREVLSGCMNFGFKPNKSLVVFGAGPVGSCFIRMAKLLGLWPVIAFDIVDEKVRKAEAMGADFAFNSTSADIESAVRGICPEGVDFAVDAVGVNSLINTAMKIIKNNGTICCYGISPKLDVQMDWSCAPYNWRVHFHQFPSKLEEGAYHNQICAWMKNGALDPADFISDVYPFEEAIAAFERVEQKKAMGKIIIRFKD